MGNPGQHLSSPDAPNPDPHRPPLPPGPIVTLPFERAFTPAQADLIRRGYRAQQMEDKWNLEFEGDRLLCRRSWTGLCNFIVEFDPLPNGGLHARRLVASRDTDVRRLAGDEDEADPATVAFLIDRLLLNDPSARVPGGPAVVAWSQFGRAIDPAADVHTQDHGMIVHTPDGPIRM